MDSTLNHSWPAFYCSADARYCISCDNLVKEGSCLLRHKWRHCCVRSSFRRLQYIYLSSTGRRLLRWRRLIQKMLSNENLLILLRRQIYFDREQDAAAIGQTIVRDRLFGHLWPKHWPSFLQHKLHVSFKADLIRRSIAITSRYIILPHSV
jgi:hypothetical protein